MTSSPMRNLMIAAGVNRVAKVHTDTNTLADEIGAGIERTLLELNDSTATLKRNLGRLYGPYGLIVITIENIGNVLDVEIYLADEEADSPEEFVDIVQIARYTDTLNDAPNAS